MTVKITVLNENTVGTPIGLCGEWGLSRGFFLAARPYDRHVSRAPARV